MLKKRTDSRKALIFYALALALALAVALMPGATTFVYAFTPLVAVAITMFAVTRDGYSKEGLKSLGLHRLGLRAWPAAFLLPLLIMGLAYGLVRVTGITSFSVPERPFDVDMPLWLLPVVVLWLIVQASLTTALGEEIGWRGYLLPRLEYLGAWGAVLLTGLLHGLWHLPVIFLTNLYHAGGNRLIVIPLFLLSVVVAGVFLGYLLLRSGSVWPAVIGHAAHNVFWSVFGLFTATSSPMVNECLVGDSGILIALGYAAFGGWLMYSLTKRSSKT